MKPTQMLRWEITRSNLHSADYGTQMIGDLSGVLAVRRHQSQIRRALL